MRSNAIRKQILDAAYELLLAVGMRRMSMADIARRADVSRATLYRRWPNVNAVVGALTTREFAPLDAARLRPQGQGRPHRGRRRPSWRPCAQCASTR